MKILITGGAGFVGSHLADKLISQGHEITVIDDLSTGRYSNIAHLEDTPNFRLIIDTVLNEKLMEELIRETDRVYHMASAVGVKLIMEHPVRTIETIFRGTDVVLGFCSRYRKRVLIPSTSEVYGKGASVPFKEDDDLQSIPVIAVTAFAMKGDEERILQGGCEGYISKPISVPHFLETIARYIGPAN